MILSEGNVASAFYVGIRPETIVRPQAEEENKKWFLRTWDSIATLLLTRSVVVMATAAEAAL